MARATPDAGELVAPCKAYRSQAEVLKMARKKSAKMDR
jgi:hypothetical protein